MGKEGRRIDGDRETYAVSLVQAMNRIYLPTDGSGRQLMGNGEFGASPCLWTQIKWAT
jgi:hypothetical protein